MDSDTDARWWRTELPVWNEERCAYLLGHTEHYLVEVLPMIYNHRIVLTPKDRVDVWDVGWCYPNFLAAVAATMLWDDPEHTEPIGAIKRIGRLPGVKLQHTLERQAHAPTHTA